MDFTCNVNSSGELTRLVLSGSINEKGATELKSHLQALKGTTRIIVLDFDAVSHIGSAGIGKLLLMYKDMSVNGTQMRIEQIPPHILELFRELKLDSLFVLTPR